MKTTLSNIRRRGQPSAVPLDREAGVDPAQLALFVIAHVPITEIRQHPGGIFRSMSRRAGAVDDDLRRFVGKHRRRQLGYPVRRNVDRVGQMTVPVIFFAQCLDEDKIVAAIQFLF